MTSPRDSAVVPPIVEWRFVDVRASEARTFQQTELSIEGEARLISLASRVGEALRAVGYSWAQIGDVLDNGSVDQMVSLVVDLAPAAPDLVTDAAMVMLGLFPTDVFGNPEPEYDADRLFIRHTINITRFADMVTVLMAQNDYQRLLRPFSRTLASAMGSLSGQASGAEPSSDDYGLEPVQLESESPTPPTRAIRTRTPGRRKSATETPSGS